MLNKNADRLHSPIDNQKDFRITLVTIDQAKEEVGLLRRAAYDRNPDMKVADSSLFWNVSDDQSYVLVAEGYDGIHATMRLECIRIASILSQKIEASSGLYPFEYPCAVLSRAATRTSDTGRGMNALLRYYCADLAKKLGMKQLIGTWIKGSPRERSMVEMGYTIFEHPTGWDSEDFKNVSPAMVGVLDLDKDYQKCLDVCAQKSNSIFQDYQWSEQVPNLRFVDRIK